MDFSIRKATMDDLDSLLTIEAECFAQEAFSRDQLIYCLFAPDFITLAALEDSEIIGFIIGSVEKSAKGNLGYIYTLDIKRVRRKHGVGGRLLESCESFLLEKGVEAFILEVRVDNIPARRLYSKHGYMPVARLKDYYDMGVDAMRLKKALIVQ